MTLITQTIPSLALIIEPIAVIIFLLIFGGRIYGMIAKAKEKSKQQEQLGGDKPQPTIADKIFDAIEAIKRAQDPNYKSGQQPTNSDMQQRLEQMRREANSSRQSASEASDDVPVLMQVNPGGPSSGSQPSNLTLEQKQLRQRAREEYERRAMELRRQRAAGQTQASGQSPAQQSPAPSSRPSSSGNAAPTPSRTTASTSPTAPSRRPSQQPMTPARAASVDPVVQIGSSYEAPTTRDKPAAAPLPSSQQKPSRRPANAPATVVNKPAAAVRTGVVDASTLRQAILWREILDKPLALRELNDRY